jgi:hypothetical protein
MRQGAWTQRTISLDEGSEEMLIASTAFAGNFTIFLYRTHIRR